MRIKVNINVKVGRVVKFFVISDFFLLAGWGLIDPVFSVFIIQRVVGGSLIAVGIAAAIYWIVRSVAQIPIANYLDSTPGEHDDFMALVGGLLLVGISAIAMCWVTRVWELYRDPRRPGHRLCVLLRVVAHYLFAASGQGCDLARLVA